METANLIAAAKTPRRSGRSAVFWYLFDRYEPLSKLPDLNHEALAAILSAKGIMDGNGNFPTRRCVADTWAKVRFIKCHGPKTRRVMVMQSAVRQAFRRAARK